MTHRRKGAWVSANQASAARTMAQKVKPYHNRHKKKGSGQAKKLEAKIVMMMIKRFNI